MKKNFIFCNLALTIVLSACGGGGGGGGGSGGGNATLVSPTTVTLFSAALLPPLQSPQFITRSSDGYLYVSDSSSTIRKISIADASATVLPAVASATGLALSTSNDLYYLANSQVNFLNQTTNASTPVFSPSSNNFAGMAFSGSTAYFANGTSFQSVAATNTNYTFTSGQVCNLSGNTPIGLAVDSTSLYATLDSGGVLHTPLGACPSLLDATTIYTDSTNLNKPKGIVIVGSYAYVVNNGTPNQYADEGFISKINLSPGALNPVTTFMNNTNGNWPTGHVGFCDPYGITAEPDGSYIYVTNRSNCLVNSANKNTILKIKL